MKSNSEKQENVKQRGRPKQTIYKNVEIQETENPLLDLELLRNDEEKGRKIDNAK